MTKMVSRPGRILVEPDRPGLLPVAPADDAWVPKTDLKVGDIVRIKICKGISGAYWSLQGHVMGMERSYIRDGDFLRKSDLRTAMLELFGERYRAAKAADSNLCSFMAVSEADLEILKPDSPPFASQRDQAGSTSDDT